MYKEKLDTLFRLAPSMAPDIIDCLKQLVKYQNFAIEEQIMIQARDNGCSISNEAIQAKNRQKVIEHDNACEACATINMYCADVGLPKIFDFEPMPGKGLSRYDQTNHAQVAFFVAAFVNEYYNLGIEHSRYDRVLDDTTFYQVDKISEKEWFGATLASLPTAGYNEERLNNAPERIAEQEQRLDTQLENFRRLLISSRGEPVQVTLRNNVQMNVQGDSREGFDVTLRTSKNFSETSAVLGPESRAGFGPGETPKEQTATDIFMSQLRDIVRQNNGFSTASVQELHLNEEITRFRNVKDFFKGICRTWSDKGDEREI